MTRDEKIGRAAFAAAVSHVKHKEAWEDIEREAQEEYTRLALAAVAKAREIDGWDERERVYERALNAVNDLINESGGVVGLHLNGDVAPWGDLLEGGCFDEWLRDLSAALRMMADRHEPKDEA